MLYHLLSSCAKLNALEHKTNTYIQIISSNNKRYDLLNYVM